MSRAKTPAAKKARAKTVAEAVIEGKPTAAIAADLGVTPRMARKIIAADETQQVIATLTNEYLDELSDLFSQSLLVIRRAFRAKAFTKEGALIGPDHYARLTAVQRLVSILSAGRPLPKPKEAKGDDEKGVLTIDQLKEFIAKQAVQ